MKTNIQKVKKFSRKFKILMIFVSVFGGWIFLAPFLAQNLVIERPLEKADAILILGGSSAYLERTREAARLYKNSVAPKIFLTNDGVEGGWNEKEQRNPLFYEQARWELLRQGVPAEAIEVLPEKVESTRDEAVLFQTAAREKNLKTVLLVTSAYHTRRTFWTFDRENTGKIEFGIIAPPPGAEMPRPSRWWLSSRGWKNVAGEYVKFLGYWLFY